MQRFPPGMPCHRHQTVHSSRTQWGRGETVTLKERPVLDELQVGDYASLFQDDGRFPGET